MSLKVSSAKWSPFCLGLNVLNLMMDVKNVEADLFRERMLITCRILNYGQQARIVHINIPSICSNRWYFKQLWHTGRSERWIYWMQFSRYSRTCHDTNATKYSRLAHSSPMKAKCVGYLLWVQMQLIVCGCKWCVHYILIGLYQVFIAWPFTENRHCYTKSNHVSLYLH